MEKTKCVGFLVMMLCLVVAGSAASQDISAQWQKTKHANRELAVQDATREGRQHRCRQKTIPAELGGSVCRMGEKARCLM